VFREEHGRAVAVLVRDFGDIEIAEDAVQEAFTIACERWPRTGLPPSPSGWIITTARNRAIDWLRRESSRAQRHKQAHWLLSQQRQQAAEPEGASARRAAAAAADLRSGSTSAIVYLTLQSNRHNLTPRKSLLHSP